MNEKIIKKIPYGVTDYGVIRTEDMYYVDKTAFLGTIEDAGKYLFFIRPRRFGKSLLLAVMETYYDILKKDRFDLYFKDTAIHRNPTKEKNDYLVLKFNFSAVDPHRERLAKSFLNNIRTEVDSFLYKYSNLLVEPILKKSSAEIDQTNSAADILFKVTKLCRDSNRKIYIIIDEYDNFANTILASSGSKAYEDLTHGEGFFKAFFNFLKEGTTGTDAPISRLFITGVSPVTLDDVTSGFNIGKNISIEPKFNEMLGFTENDVIEMIEYYRGHGLIKHPTPYLMEIMNAWYNNYVFSKNSETTLFNSDMVLYFIDLYKNYSEVPDNLIDRNVRIDYGKLRHLIILDSEKGKLPNGNFSRLKEIIEKGEIKSKEIVEGFPVEKITHTKNFLSLLFYFGLLTVKGVEAGEVLLQIPNETVRQLFYDYISEAYEETGTFSLDWYHYDRLMHAMAYEGKWKPLFEYISKRMKESMSLRDLITGEKSIQAFLTVYLGLSQIYIIHPERELNKGFADIFLEPFTARYHEMKYAYILEIKYLKKGAKKDVKKDIGVIVKEAEAQLQKYSLDAKLKKSIENKTLIKLVLVFSGTELKYIGETGGPSRSPLT
ncbi:MAG: AAA family ATPase [bacterium]|nr:AAA family ATPase [bacterium]